MASAKLTSVKPGVGAFNSHLDGVSEWLSSSLLSLTTVGETACVVRAAGVDGFPADRPFLHYDTEPIMVFSGS
jgi:hypothetical protein